MVINPMAQAIAGRSLVEKAFSPRPQRPLRILILNYEYAPMGGGAGNATRCTATELARRRHVVHVVTSRLPAQPAVQTVDGVTIYRVLSWRRSLQECGLLGALSYIIFGFIALVRLARTSDYDVFHFYFGLPTGILALYVHFVLDKPYVLGLRGSDVPGYDETRWYLRPLHGILRPLSRFLWSRARFVVTPSSSLRSLALQTKPDLQSLVIPNGISSERFPAKPAGRKPGPLRLVSVCRIVRRKGLDYLIEAMEELRKDGIVLDLIGSGEEEANIAALVRSRGLGEHVKFHGYIASEELYRYYHEADVFVLPSLSESFGQAFLEAMSCGLPVIGSSIGGIPETVRPNRNGLLVPPRDPAAIVEAVRWMAANERQREGMGLRNAQEARDCYSWETVASLYEELSYRAVHEQSSRTRHVR